MGKAVEFRQLQQMIRSLSFADALAPPFCIEEGFPSYQSQDGYNFCERPDFVLSRGALKIGVEVTEFTDWARQRAMEFVREYPKGYSFTGIWDNEQCSSLEQVKNKLYSLLGPWDDIAEVARHIVSKVLASIEKKQIKFRTPGFRKYDQNWLVLSDFCEPFTNHHLYCHIRKEIINAWPQLREVRKFDRIYIFAGPYAFLKQGDYLNETLDLGLLQETGEIKYFTSKRPYV